MSVAVALEELGRQVDEYGPRPFLVTTSEDGRPHVVSVTVAFEGRTFSLAAGKTSRANAERLGAATLLWPGVGGDYCLIVDGRATPGTADGVVLEPTRAVLHRFAGAPEDLPSCVAI